MRLLGVGIVAREIPHARAIPDGAHIIVPVNQVLVGIATDCREGAFLMPGELGSTGVCERGVAGFPRFLTAAGLKEIQVLNSGRYAWMRECPRGVRHRAKKREGCEYNEFFHFWGI